MATRNVTPGTIVIHTTMRAGRRLAIALAIAATACAGGGRPSGNAPPGQPGVRAQVSDRLYFGMAIPGGGMVTDSAWRVFLREVITPAFPEGLTIWRAEGQWLDPRGEIVKEPVTVLEVIHPPGTPADSVFERIAETYRLRFRQDAVLRITTDARFQLYEQRSTRPD